MPRLELPARIVMPTAGQPTVSMAACWSYEPADPFALQLTFPEGGPRRRPVVWTFDCALLAEGLHRGPGRPAGEGDVSCWAAADRLYVRLATSSTVIVTFDRALLARWVDTELRPAMPVGAALTGLLDAELDRLLDGGSA